MIPCGMSSLWEMDSGQDYLSSQSRKSGKTEHSQEVKLLFCHSTEWQISPKIWEHLTGQEVQVITSHLVVLSLKLSTMAMSWRGFSCGQKYCCMLVPTCEGMSEKKNQNVELHKHKTTHKPHYFSPIPSGVFFSLKAFRWTRDKSSINPTVWEVLFPRQQILMCSQAKIPDDRL